MTNDAREQPPGDSEAQATGRSATGPAGQNGTSPAPLLEQFFDWDSLYALRAAVGAHASQAGLPQERADDLVVAVHELAANALRHGAGHGWARMWLEPHALRCEVAEDGSAPAAPGPADPPSSQEAAPWPIRHGHGLWLVQEVADQVSLRQGPAGGTATISFLLVLPDGG